MNRPQPLPPPSGRNPWRRLLDWILWILTIFVSAGLVLSGYGGNIAPVELRGISIMVMLFPFWLLGALIVLVLDLIACRKAALIGLVAFAAIIPSIWNYSPFNLHVPAPKDGQPQFTLLTYNVSNLTDLTGQYPGDTNPTLRFILGADADIVCLQELRAVVPEGRKHISRELVDSVYERYPYIVLNGLKQTLLSKYPVETLRIAPTRGARTADIAAYRLNIEGLPVTLFNVHLQSYALNADDKALYRDAVRLKAEEQVGEIKNELFRKIERAALYRADDAEDLARYIDHYGGPNVMVAGDFNDVPGCYTLRRLADCGLSEVYPAVGFGPMITFNRDHFFFRIDHVLWRGSLRPLSMRRGSLLSSDHYPLLTTFAVGK